MVGNVPDSNTIRLKAAMERWHNGHKNSGTNAQDDLKALNEGIESHANVKQFLESLGQGRLIDPSIADALIAKWKSDPKFLTNLNNDLADPNNATLLRQAINSNDPKERAGLIATIANYGNDNSQAPAPSGSGGATPTTPPAASTPPPAAPPPAAPPPAASGRGGGHGTQSRSGQEQPANLVVDFAQQLAEKAKRDFGIDPAIANGFVGRVRGDKNLQKEIYAQMQKHPDLRNTLNDFLLVDVNALRAHKPKARAALVELLQNPELLKQDEYVTALEANVAIMPKNVAGGTTSGRVSGQRRDASGAPTGGAGGSSPFSTSGFMGGLQDMFENLKSFFASPGFMQGISQIWEQIKQLFSSLTSTTGLAMGSSGNGMSRHLADATGNGEGYHARTRSVHPNTGAVDDGYRGDVTTVGPQSRRPSAGGAAPGGTNGPGGHAVV